MTFEGYVTQGVAVLAIDERQAAEPFTVKVRIDAGRLWELIRKAQRSKGGQAVDGPIVVKRTKASEG